MPRVYLGVRARPSLCIGREGLPASEASNWFRLASIATMLTQHKPSEGHRRFGLAMMAARMDENEPFQASKWSGLASMATMLTQHKTSEGLRRFGLATMTAWMDENEPFQASKWFQLASMIHGHNVDSTQTF